MVPDLKPGVPHEAAPRVEIRWCEPVGPPLQIAAWAERASSASFVLDMYRDSVSQIVMSDNVFAMVFPGGYDSIVVVQFQGGEPKVVFMDSTHAEIRLATTSNSVQVTLDYGDGRKDTKAFAVDESQLSVPEKFPGPPPAH